MMTQSYDSTLVILSVFVSFLGSLTGLNLAARSHHATGRARVAWVGASAVALSAGAIWSMHFVGMLALHLGPVVVRYDLSLTVLSLLIAMVFTSAGMGIVAGSRPGRLPIVLAGTIMGLGIGAMHYSGMSAMKVDAAISYDAALVSVSLLIAAVASAAALWLSFNLRTHSARWNGALVMAGAVAGMHYTGMAAAHFTPHQLHIGVAMESGASDGLSRALLAAAVLIAVSVVLGLGLFAAYFDKRIRDARQREVHEVAAARAGEDRWRKTLDTLPQMVWCARPDGSEEYLNRQWFTFAGFDLGEPEAESRMSLLHPDDVDVLDQWRRCVESGHPYEAEYRLRHVSGEYRWVLSRGQPERNETGQVSRWYGTCTDIHERVVAQEALRESERFSRSIIEASPDCLSILDRDGNVLFANDAALSAYGLEDDAPLLGRPWGSLLLAGAWEGRDAALASARGGGIGRLTLSLPNIKGELRWYESLVAPLPDATGKPVRYMVMSRDITGQKEAEDQMRWVAGHDALTQLPNRSFFQQQLEEAIGIAKAGGDGFALLLADIDEFKQTNDTLGHDAGDALLCTAASRLRDSLRHDDFVARFGGDEFAIILKGVTSDAAASAAAEGILNALRGPWVHDGRISDCRLSVGVSIYGRDGDEVSTLVKNADIALYTAKLEGRGRLALFDPGMRAEMQKRSSMLSVARRAVQDDLVFPFYQPKVDLKTGRAMGFEALLRWRHPTHGIQLPCSVAAGFEDLELAAEMADCMLSRVIADITVWLEQGVDFGHVAINAAAADFKQGDFAERLIDRLDRNHIPRTCLQVEVTESVFLGRGADYVETALKTLNANDIRIALDDFGTGYGSLSHLKQFPVDILKIDRSFIQNLQDDTDNAAIVRAVLNLGRSLELEVVAEGVETKAQETYLRSHGCRFAQGFLYGKASPASDVPKFIDCVSQARRVA